MSNATENSRDSGESRRRRSRGGQNRRNNNNNNNENRSSQGRQSGGGRRDGESSGRQQGSASGKPQRRPMPAPIKLTWWQKLLKTIGLYKEPVRPPRPERRPDATEEAKDNREPRRTKTRDARSESSRDDEASPRQREDRRERGDRGERGERRERGDRNDRGERQGNRPRGGDPSTVENRRVYVGNLSYDVTESDLEELFKGVGAVRRVEIVYNRSTHRSKGYGFIEMLDIDEAKRTVEVLHDQFFMGRKLTVSGAKSEEHSQAEKDDEVNSVRNQEMPPLAPIRPQVTSLIDEPVTEPAPELVAEVEIPVIEENLEVPTEEFSPEENEQEKVNN